MSNRNWTIALLGAIAGAAVAVALGFALGFDALDRRVLGFFLVLLLAPVGAAAALITWGGNSAKPS